MKKKTGVFLLTFILCLSLFGCGNSDYGDTKETKRKFANNSSDKVKLEEYFEENYNNYMVATGQASELMLVYMVGSNLESEGGLASADIEEMQKSGFLSDNLKILICTGGTNYWWNDDIDPEEVAVYEVVSGTEEINKLTVLNGENMAEAATLTEFLDYAYTNNKDANYYSLVLWNHGGGAVLGYGGDERYDYDSLSVTEMDEAFTNSLFISEGKKFEWVGFDACLMGMIEIAELFEPFSNYLIASEELIPGDGWDYTCLGSVANGTDFTGQAAGKAIIDQYANYYDNYKWGRPEYTLSCLDLGQTQDVMTSFDALISVTENDLINGEYSQIARQRGNTKAFGIIDEELCYDTVDLYNLAENMAETHSGEAAALINSLENMIVYERDNVVNAHGVAIYFPYNNKLYAEDWVNEYSLCDFSDTYMKFVKNFTETFYGAPLTAWDLDDEDATVEIAEGEASEVVGDIGSLGNFSIQLTSDQVANFASADLQIWEIIENYDVGAYAFWIDSSDVSLDGNGVLSSMIANKRFVLRDTSGNQADCCAFEIERGDGYAIYTVKVFVSFKDDNGEYDMDRYFCPYNIYIRVDDENPNGVISGIYSAEEEESGNLLPNKRSDALEQDCLIQPFMFGRIIKFNDDGTVAPVDDWELFSGLFYDFNLNGDLYVDMVDIDPDVEKVYIYSIGDTQGNSYVVNVLK